MSPVPAACPAATVHIAHWAELRQGYTLAHLNDLAVRAVRVQRFSRQGDFNVRVEITRPTALTEEVRQRKRRRARVAATTPTGAEQDPA